MAKFAAKPGEWDCDACYVRNSADKTMCAACSTPKPGAAPAKPTSMPSTFKFGTQQPQATADTKVGL